MAGAEVHDNNSATNRAASAGTLGAARCEAPVTNLQIRISNSQIFK
jgi:hypothetical protein